MARCLYNNSFEEFIKTDDNAILGELCDKYHGDALTTTRDAWKSEIAITKEVLSGFTSKNGDIIFEYDIPRLGKRLDVVLLLNGIIFCLEYNLDSEDGNMQRVYDFLKEVETYYLATIDGDQPRVRPFGTVNVFEDKLYIQTGKGKAVNEQIKATGKVELCAMKGDEWIRVSGTIVVDDRVEAGEAMLDAYPNLRNMYTTGENGNSVVYYFKDATAVIASFSHAPETIKF